MTIRPILKYPGAKWRQSAWIVGHLPAHTRYLEPYADPPYPLATRAYNLYPDEEHLALLEALDRHPGPVVLSGYGCPLYDERLTHWRCVTAQSVAEYGRARVEVLWLNRQAQHAQLAMWPETTKEVLA